MQTKNLKSDIILPRKTDFKLSVKDEKKFILTDRNTNK